MLKVPSLLPRSPIPTADQNIAQGAKNQEPSVPESLNLYKKHNTAPQWKRVVVLPPETSLTSTEP